MTSAFNNEILKKHLPDEVCTGRRPWLGSKFEREDCSSAQKSGLCSVVLLEFIFQK
jgi:hypothetical protein